MPDKMTFKHDQLAKRCYCCHNRPSKSSELTRWTKHIQVFACSKCENNYDHAIERILKRKFKVHQDWAGSYILGKEYRNGIFKQFALVDLDIELYKSAEKMGEWFSKNPDEPVVGVNETNQDLFKKQCLQAMKIKKSVDNKKKEDEKKMKAALKKKMKEKKKKKNKKKKQQSKIKRTVTKKRKVSQMENNRIKNKKKKQKNIIEKVKEISGVRKNTKQTPNQGNYEDSEYEAMMMEHDRRVDEILLLEEANNHTQHREIEFDQNGGELCCTSDSSELQYPLPNISKEQTEMGDNTTSSNTTSMVFDSQPSTTPCNTDLPTPVLPTQVVGMLEFDLYEKYIDKYEIPQAYNKEPGEDEQDIVGSDGGQVFEYPENVLEQSSSAGSLPLMSSSPSL